MTPQLLVIVAKLPDDLALLFPPPSLSYCPLSLVLGITTSLKKSLQCTVLPVTSGHFHLCLAHLLMTAEPELLQEAFPHRPQIRPSTPAPCSHGRAPEPV